jgi:predicted enzyme related to lactoylglutathione lyase
LETAGVKFEGKIEEIPGIVRLTTFRDPSGNRLQLAQPLMQS